MGSAHTSFVHWALSGGLQDFWQYLRWPGWVEETSSLRDDPGITVYPPLATAEGQDIATANGAPVLFKGLLALNQDLARQVRLLPDGRSFHVETTED